MEHEENRTALDYEPTLSQLIAKLRDHANGAPYLLSPDERKVILDAWDGVFVGPDPQTRPAKPEPHVETRKRP